MGSSGLHGEHLLMERAQGPPGRESQPGPLGDLCRRHYVDSLAGHLISPSCLLRSLKRHLPWNLIYDVCGSCPPLFPLRATISLPPLLADPKYHRRGPKQQKCILPRSEAGGPGSSSLVSLEAFLLDCRRPSLPVSSRGHPFMPVYVPITSSYKDTCQIGRARTL